MATKISVRLNGRKQVALFLSNSTPFVIEGKVVSKPFYRPTTTIKRTCDYFNIPVPKELDIKTIFKPKTFFDVSVCGKLGADNNKRILDFVEACNAALITHPEFKTAKEVATFVLGGCKEESLNASITFADFLDIVINDQRGKEENPDSNNFQVYITLRNSLKNWGGYNSIISDLKQADFENLSTYLKNRKGKNGKKGANFERMMQCYRAVINAAVSPRYNKVTGCNASNKVVLDKQNPTIRLKQRSNKSFVDIYKEKELEGALTFEQVEAFKNFDLYTIDVKIPSWHNNKKYEYTPQLKDVELWYDILKFMLSVGGIRPVDAIRIKVDNIDFEHNRIIYLPHKENRFANDDKELFKHLVSVPFNTDNLEIINKYAGINANGFLFPCSCNVLDNGKYNYKRINQVELCMNALLKEIGTAIGLSFKPTNYTIRKTSITCNADTEYKALKLAAMEKAAKLAGTSYRYVKETYYKPVNNVY